MMYKLRIKAFVLCMIITLLSFNVYGADPVSGLLQSAANSITNNIGRPADVGDLEETYDKESGFYNEKLGEGIEFLSSIPNGAVVSDAVYFDMPLGIINVDLEYEGNKVDFKNKSLIYGKGYYILRLSAPSGTDEPLIGVFTFRISGAPMNRTPSVVYRYPVVSCTAAISDYEGGMYKYTLPNYKSFLTNVSAYGENVDNAKFVIPRNMGYSFLRNGQKISLVNNQTYSEAGNYNLRVYGSSYAQEGGYEAYYETVLSFSIGSEENSGSSLSGGTSSGGNRSGSSSSGSTTAGSIGSAVSSAAGSIGSSVGSAAGSIGSAVGSVSSAADSTRSSLGSVGSSISGGLSNITNRFGIGSDNNEIINDYLSETYFESAELYSETFSSGDSFYTNTPEDGIVGGNVYIDIPYNMTVSMTKDGLPVSFENKTYINEVGSYSLLVTDIDGDDVKTARYTFRIQEGVDRSPAIEGALQFSDIEGAQDMDSVSSAVPQIDEKDIEFDSSVKYNVENSYNKDMGMYSFKAGNTEFYMSIPDGMVSNYDVLINIPAGVETKLTRNGEEMDFSSELNEDGHYELTVTDTGSDEETTVSFDIIYYSTNSMDRFVTPEGYYIAVAQYGDYYGMYVGADDKDYVKNMDVINHQISTPSNVFEMPLDGEYDFILQGQRGMPVLSATVILDRVAPVVGFEGLGKNMKTKEQSITASCTDPEAVFTLTDSEGNESDITFTDGRASIEGNGKYTLTATDMAGNSSSYEFTLGAKGGSVLKFILIAVLVLILILLVLFIILVRKGKINSLPLNGMKDRLAERKADKDNDKAASASESAEENTNDDWETSASDDWENTDNDDWENTDGGIWGNTDNDDWENTDNDDWESIDDDDWENS